MKKSIQVTSPEENEKVHQILSELFRGKTREELAAELNYSTYKSLDIYMRRNGYTYDKHKKNYIPQIEEVQIETDTSKVSRIIQLFNDPNQIPEDICVKTGFSSLTELSNYMLCKGYRWHSEINNYRKDPSYVVPTMMPKKYSDEHEQPTRKSTEIESMDTLHEYLPILKMLKHNQERLSEILLPFGKGCTLPRYTIEGIAKTKTVQMIHSLSNLVTEFADEKNISQREIFEVALVDFFRKYGYEKEAAQMLKIR